MRGASSVEQQNGGQSDGYNGVIVFRSVCSLRIVQSLHESAVHIPVSTKVPEQLSRRLGYKTVKNRFSIRARVAAEKVMDLTA